VARAAEPIDRAAFDALVESLDNDAGFVAELVDAYVRDASALVASMGAAGADGRSDELARLAHTLKSTSAALCATVLPSLCQTIESRVRAGELEELIEQVGALEVEAGRVEHALRARAASL
jgi:HPt (histidine-containing phosphotransfer) domain-containing protein